MIPGELLPVIPTDAWTPCQRDPEAWFQNGNYNVTRQAAADCRRCYWRVECFVYAATPENNVTAGIWGGFNFSDWIEPSHPDAVFIDRYRQAVWGPYWKTRRKAAA